MVRLHTYEALLTRMGTAFTPPVQKQSARSTEVRVCATCETRLSMYNGGLFCSACEVERRFA